jgi:hypothetical protein
LGLAAHGVKGVVHGIITLVAVPDLERIRVKLADKLQTFGINLFVDRGKGFYGRTQADRSQAGGAGNSF